MRGSIAVGLIKLAEPMKLGEFVDEMEVTEVIDIDSLP